MAHKGKCFCGSVEITVTGEPVAMGYCHCSSCREWSAEPIHAFTGWPADSVKVTKGAGNIGTYHRTEKSWRKWCTACGGHLFIDHPGIEVIDVPAAVVPSVKFVPALHVNYQEAVLAVKDGLPKYRDEPKEFGGSGELALEQ